MAYTDKQANCAYKRLVMYLSSKGYDVGSAMKHLKMFAGLGVITINEAQLDALVNSDPNNPATTAAIDAALDI